MTFLSLPILLASITALCAKRKECLIKIIKPEIFLSLNIQNIIIFNMVRSHIFIVAFYFVLFLWDRFLCANSLHCRLDWPWTRKYVPASAFQRSVLLYLVARNNFIKFILNCSSHCIKLLIRTVQFYITLVPIQSNLLHRKTLVCFRKKLITHDST